MTEYENQSTKGTLRVETGVTKDLEIMPYEKKEEEPRIIQSEVKKKKKNGGGKLFEILEERLKFELICKGQENSINKSKQKFQ